MSPHSKRFADPPGPVRRTDVPAASPEEPQASPGVPSTPSTPSGSGGDGY
ncbi:hypothetical protein [Streptantibioticus parmotrematis]|nr:hypothetical protein [Streptantibioticus parmotrematis]